MKKFLFKVSFYLVGLVAVFGVLGSFADGNTDDNYMHFAVEKPHHMILGDSRDHRPFSRKFWKESFSENLIIFV
ncbi:hypothetical protein ODZ84_15675 [Chryseobacterium fluminis]|uniref:hypothetical protein n=1 Tax=Chryseobacterium fluminis TaxID=2983606 RepID=UPI002256AB8C|nr:hypothetical protein [Chryseobacterium sp. MMS21-Ot14]UZT96655.1 hypothetical protein ODZ84_15675 [Chryseobacterium sp. MMS21-Ot14]